MYEKLIEKFPEAEIIETRTRFIVLLGNQTIGVGLTIDEACEDAMDGQPYF
jgi:hypothetical protein